jgi:hypothetical protein
MKRFSFLVMALIMLFVSCETYEEQNVKLTYEVKSIESASIVDKDSANLVGLFTGGIVGLVVADVATDTLDKIDTDKYIKTEKYVLSIRAIGDNENPIVLGQYGARIECEGVKKTWEVGDYVETEQYVSVKKNTKGEYKISQFNNAKTSYFKTVKTKYK